MTLAEMEQLGNILNNMDMSTLSITEAATILEACVEMYEKIKPIFEILAVHFYSRYEEDDNGTSGDEESC